MSNEDTGTTRRGVPLARRALVASAITGVLSLATSACVAAPSTIDLTIASGEHGGFYERFATLLARVLSTGGAATADVLLTAGSTENISLVHDGNAALGLALLDSVRSSALQDVVALGRVYQNYLHCLVSADSDIQHLTDLTDRLVSTGAIGAGAVLTANRVLAAAGIASARNRPLGLASGLAALARGEIEALFWSGGIPTPAIELRAPRLRLLDLRDSLTSLQHDHPGLYQTAEIPAGVYGRQQPITTIGVSNLLVCTATLPPHTADGIVTALVGRAQELVPPGAKGTQYLSVDNLTETGGIPLHPAAEAAYRRLHG